MVWRFSPAGQRDPLLQAVKQAVLATSSFTAIQRSGQDILLSFASLPLALYRVQWTTNLASGVWNTLSNNVSGTGGNIRVADPGAVASQSPRQYRLRTPP